MCSNSFIDKGLFFLSDIFKIKKYGLISSWDHLSTKDLLIYTNLINYLYGIIIFVEN